jgi:methionine-rich copper-binding protein CopC
MLAYTIRGKTALGFYIDFSHETENPDYKIDWVKSRDPNNSGLKGLNAGDNYTIVNFASAKDTTSPIVVSLETTDSTSQQFLFEITDRTINGFTVRFSSPIPTDNYILNWIIPSSDNSGVEPLPNGLDETTIVFSNPTLNTVNAVVATIINIADATASMYPFKVIEKTITSFKIKFSSPIDSNNYYLAWEVVGAENKLDEFLFIQTGGFRHFDEEGVFDCTHGFDLISITIEDVTDYLLLEDGFYLLQENGSRILL